MQPFYSGDICQNKIEPLSFKMQHQEFVPPDELRDTIKCFWYNRGYFGETQTSFEVVPDGYAEIIFYFGSLSQKTDDGGLQPLPSPFMMGLLNQPAVFYTSGLLQIIGVRCYPWTVFDLLGLPSAKDGIRIFDHPAAALQPSLNKLTEAGDINESVKLVEHYFLKARGGVATDSLLFKAGLAMSSATGNMPVSEVAAAAHSTVRTLERRFKQSSGYSVKDVSGLMRFEQARNHLWQYPDANLAGLAHELGYTDQAHLSKEFKRYSGTSPAVFARATKKRKGLISEDFVAFIKADTRNA